jgi:hypothetical protein
MKKIEFIIRGKFLFFGWRLTPFLGPMDSVTLLFDGMWGIDRRLNSAIILI